MESLYVCLFSNGHIKVGRSIDPKSRIASHADRVACMGVSLTQSYITECPDACEQRERNLIEQCAKHATERFASEWFSGLYFDQVTLWAYEAAHASVAEATFPETRWTKVIADLRKAGWTQADLARECQCGATTISRLALGQQAEPMHSMGETLLRLAKSPA